MPFCNFDLNVHWGCEHIRCNCHHKYEEHKHHFETLSKKQKKQTRRTKPNCITCSCQTWNPTNWTLDDKLYSDS